MALFIDESNILAGLREVRTANAAAPFSVAPFSNAPDATTPLALCTVLGVGVFSVAQLSSVDDIVGPVSPFNVFDAICPPMPTPAEVIDVIHAFDAEYGVTTPDEIVFDVIWKSGMHVGLVSFLGQQLTALSTPRAGCDHFAAADVNAWWVHMCSPQLLAALLASPTILRMLCYVRLGAYSTSVTLRARELVRTLLAVPEWAPATIDVSHQLSQAATEMLLSEGVIVHDPGAIDSSSDCEAAEGDRTTVIASFPACSARPGYRFRLSAPLLAQPLLATVGSRAAFFSHTLAGVSFSMSHRLDFVKTVIECLPYFSAEGLVHRFSLLHDGTPCEYAYHAQLYSILHARAASDVFLNVLFESRDPKRSPLRHLDITLLDRISTGIELFVEGKGLLQHVQEQAPTYRRQRSG